MAETTDERLKLLIERIERIEEEEKDVKQTKSDAYQEAKAVGYDTKIMRMIIALRKKRREDRLEEEALVTTYMCALGME